MKASKPELTLLETLGKLVLPSVRQHGMTKILVAPSQWKRGLELPEGISATHCPLRGKRVARRGLRPYGDSAIENAVWPEDGLHSTRSPRLCFIVNGTATLRIADSLFLCRAGLGVIVPADVPSALHLAPTSATAPRSQILSLVPYEGGLICWLTRERRDAQHQPYLAEETSSIPHSQVPFYLDLLISEAAGQTLHQREICDALLEIVCSLLHRELQQLPTFHTGERMALSQTNSQDDREYSMAQTQKYIHLNLREPLSIDKVARAACMSRTRFTAQFRRQTGKSFAQYVTDLRFEEACKILKQTDLGVQHVGSLVGLKPCRMRSLFQERAACSPSDYRRASRQQTSES